ncbi:MAG: nucleotide exchange factor GrpE [Candidatus Eisenbacteria bacterium]|uniref:Protein GrpE n=1 Tax=Eiseniibacteriota bacterium TaxID=2212470 RepID=A0A538SYF3_UNCEI|nr:MAG: nucleotide exchange factor GrpE [Candidatus Eisenbacteria bacterium]
MSVVSDSRGRKKDAAQPGEPAGHPSATDEGTAPSRVASGAEAEPTQDVASGAGEATAPPQAAPAAPPEPAAAAKPTPAPAAPTAAELQDRWLRAEADLRNLRRRAALEREEARRSAEDGVLLELISMLDDLDRALESARESGAPDSWTAGVRLTADRVRERLSRYGVATLDPKGAPFDPRFHEALLEIDAPEGVSPGAVVQVAHLGYARGERALRPARVVVARAPAAGGA